MLPRSRANVVLLKVRSMDFYYLHKLLRYPTYASYCLIPNCRFTDQLIAILDFDKVPHYTASTSESHAKVGVAVRPDAKATKGKPVTLMGSPALSRNCRSV
jgi:hypothetical protein